MSVAASLTCSVCSSLSPSGGNDGILLLMFTLLPKEQAHVTIVIATKRFFPWSLHLRWFIFRYRFMQCFQQREEACILILCICVTDLPSWLLCWLLCCVARTCRTWRDGGSLALAVHNQTGDGTTAGRHSGC